MQMLVLLESKSNLSPMGPMTFDDQVAIVTGAGGGLGRKRNIYIHPFLEDDVKGIIDIMGEDHVMFGSDFPHPEGIGDPLSFVDRLDGVSESAKVKIMGGNAIEQLRLKVPA